MVSKRRQYFCFGVMISAGSRLFSKVLICLLDKVKTFIPILQYFESYFSTNLSQYMKYHHKSVMHTTIDYSFYFFSSSGVTLSNLNSNAFTEINISFTEIPNEITNSNKATPNV